MERLFRVLSFACALPLFVACGDPPTGGDEDASMPDGATDMDAAMTDPDSSMPEAGPADPMVRFVEPAANVQESSAPVPLRVVVDTVVERVDILLDGTVIANLAVPYAFTLVTANLALGEHVLIPRALVAGTTFDGPAITVTIERTAPEFEAIASSLPSGLLPARTPIHVTFDEVLDAASLASVNVTVQDNGAPAAGVLTHEGNVLVFTPTLPWSEDKWVSIAVSGSVVDLHGNVAEISENEALRVRTYWPTSITIGTDAAGSLPGTADYLFAGIDRFSSSNPTGSLEVVGRVDGTAIVAPEADVTLDRIRRVDAGIDAQGVAYIAYEQFNQSTNARELVVARRDPMTATWSKQTVLPTDVVGAISALSLHVSAGGHALLRFATGGPSVTYHRGPNDSAFTVTSLYNGFNVSDHPAAFPGTEGRSCGLQSTVDYDAYEVTYDVVCENGGIAPNTVFVAGPFSLFDTSWDFRASAGGDAVLAINRDVYLFDGDTETLSTGTTLPSAALGTTVALGISPLGHVCATQVSFGGPMGSIGLSVMKRAPGEGFGAPFFVPVPGEVFAEVSSVVADDAGHCFVDLGGSVVHDATFDGSWAAPFGYFGNQFAAQLFAGAANQVFLARSVNIESAYVFTPLTP